jgi:hypothetical protein
MIRAGRSQEKERNGNKGQIFWPFVATELNPKRVKKVFLDKSWNTLTFFHPFL